MSMWRPELDSEKYKQVILYLLNSAANNLLLGKVKLFKLLYYVDFDHFEKYRVPITGDMYTKLPYGPVPTHAQQVLAGMETEGLIDITTRMAGDCKQYVFTPASEANIGAFTTSEMEILEQVVAKWARHTTNNIVAATHGEAPWRAVDMGELIPYALAFYRRQVLKWLL